MQCKIADPNVGIWAQMRQELTTALVQVFMNLGTATGRVFLWAACLQRFKLK